MISKARGSIFYDTKTVLLNRILNATAQRKPDQAAPEITLDPLENVGGKFCAKLLADFYSCVVRICQNIVCLFFAGETKPALDSNFCQAFRQMLNVPSSQLCVRLAAGGDPTYAFNVRLTGEEVHGTSKTLVRFNSQVCVDCLM